MLCHVRMADISGMGLKAPDALAAFGCDACHAVCDGQRFCGFDPVTRRLMLLEGVMRTQKWFIDHGYLRW